MNITKKTAIALFITSIACYSNNGHDELEQGDFEALSEMWAKFNDKNKKEIINFYSDDDYLDSTLECFIKRYEVNYIGREKHGK